MNKIFTLIFLFSFAPLIFCRAQTIRQLSNLYENGIKLEKEKKYSAAIEVFKKGYFEALKLKSDTFQLAFLFRIGKTYNFQAKLDSTQLYFKKAQQLLYNQKKDYTSFKIKLYIAKSQLFNKTHNTDSNSYYVQLLQKIETRLDKKSIEFADIDKTIAYYFVRLNKTEEALPLFLNALTIYEMRLNKFGIASTYLGLAFLFSTTENFEKSGQYIREAAKIFEELHDTYNLSLAYLEYANGYCLNTNQIDSMRFYLRKSKELLNSINDEAKYYSTDNSKDNFHLINPVDTVKTVILKKTVIDTNGYPVEKKLIEEAEIKKDYKNLSGLYTYMGRYHLKRKEYSKSEYFFLKDFKLHLLRKDKEQILSSYIELIDLYEAQDKWKEANRLHRLAKNLKDSLNQISSNRIVTEAEAKYQAERKQQQILVLNQQNNSQRLELAVQQRNLILLIICILLVSTLVFFSYKRYQLRKKLEMEQIRSRIAADFHDELGANLSSIALYSDILLKNHSAEAGKNQPLIENISQNARQTITAINDLIWTIKPDNDLLERTIVRMKEYAYPLMEAKNIVFEFEVSDKLKELQLNMNTRKFIYLIFKEAINNALKYSGAGFIYTSLTLQGNNINMKIRDNGKGFDQKLVSNGNGLGNMQKRVSELGGNLIIESSPGRGTFIQIHFKVT